MLSYFISISGCIKVVIRIANDRKVNIFISEFELFYVPSFNTHTLGVSCNVVCTVSI